MIDFHSHLLPGIDDGSRNIEESSQMVQAEMEDGVDTIIATPHFYADRTTAEKYLKKRSECEAELRSCLETMDTPPRLLIGAEVCYFQGIGRAEILEQLCIQGTETLLVEMPFAQWTEENYKDIKTLVHRRKFQVILAHVERYPQYQTKKDIWDAVMDLPLTKQINTGSLVKKGLFDKKYRFCINTLRQEPHVLLGTDCHNLTSRKPNMAVGRKTVEKELGAEKLAQIDKWGAALLNKE